MIVKLHHVEILCNNIFKRLGQFCTFGFRPFAEAVHPKRIVVKRNSIYFVLTECRETRRDTISNVTLEVNDVDNTTHNVHSNGGKVLNYPRVCRDSYGQTLSSVIQTPCGNVQHTLLDKSNYLGLFLPGFNALSAQTSEALPKEFLERSSDEDALTHLDHIAFACHRGTSLQIIDWYRRCLGFTRSRVNLDERIDGFTVQAFVDGAYVGIKLSAMEYWNCSELGIEVKSNHAEKGVKFVLAEPLPGQGPNQITTFLEEHGGPGIQHLGLHSTDMINVVEQMKDNGVQFIRPPDAYYTQPDKISEIISAGHTVECLQNQSILLDAESFTSEDNRTKYLMQVFTKPLFDENTFFMEIIQRYGATGFGTGNITALWKALDQHMQQKS